MKKFARQNWTHALRIVGILIVVALAGSILWRAWYETLGPLLSGGDASELSLPLIGMPLTLMGAITLAIGGILFVNRTSIAFGDETFHDRASFVRTDPRPEARREVWMLNLRMLGRLWQPALILLAMAFVLIIVGGRLINM